MLEELLDEAPVTWARSYGGPLLPPMMLREPITDFPLDIPVLTGVETKISTGFIRREIVTSASRCASDLAASWTASSDAARIPAAPTTAREPRSHW